MLPSNPSERIVIAADSGRHWTEGAYEVWLLEGHCYINQGLTYARSDQAVLRIEPGGPQGDPPNKIIAFLEGNVTIDSQPAAGEPAKLTAEREVKLKDRSWLGRFYSSRPLKIDVPNPGGEPQPKPAVYQHAQAARDAEISTPITIPWRQTQFAEPIAPPAGQPSDVPPVGARRIRFLPRAPGVPFQAQSIPKPGSDEQMVVISSGVNVIIDGLRGFGSIDVQTDRLVIWTSGVKLSGFTAQNQPENMPLEMYMEGNIIFRQGERVIEANRMYYNVRTKTGMVLGAEIRSPVPDYEGLLKLKADVVRQLDEHHFVAENVSLTSSRFGVPGYDFRTGVATYEDIQAPLVDPYSQQPLVNPATGEPAIDHQRMITSQNNFLYVENFPVFYWPFFATDAKPSNYYIERIRFRQDSIFGTQLLTDFNAYQVFGIRNKPAGTKWDISLDAFSERGFAAGTSFSYNRENLFNIPGPYYGLIDVWGLKDDGNDNLGRDRRSLVPESDVRGRILARHRQFLPDNFQLTAEVGLISDRNFLEQWYEHEWDEFKDPTTGLELKQIQDNASWSISADFRPNGAWTDTQWLPRLDHFWLGQPLLGDRLTWYEHSNVAYAQMKLASKPLNPDDYNKFTLLPWESGVEGERVATRQELDLPFTAGPVKVVPYALGEVAHWGEALNGNDFNRAYGQIGLRASLPMWTAEPGIQSDLLNLNGLAHKVVFDADIAFTDASRNVDELPLYDPIDDNVIETFRRRFAFDTFGAPGVPAFPEKFDPRFYAIRRGLAGSVTSPSTEIADDLLAARFGIRQRWQTKRGGPNSQRLIDWIQFDTEAVVFPDPSRDNFGTAVGMVNYNFLWNVGERFTVTSDGMFDFFSDGPKYVAIGGFLNRPPRGTWFAGIRTLQGPISATVLSSSYSYRMSDKWISTMGSSYAFGKTGNIGQNFGLTRIGESLLVSLGLNIDSSKGNVGAVFAIEPRFLPRTRLGAAGGVQIPPAGAFGLE